MMGAGRLRRLSGHLLQTNSKGAGIWSNSLFSHSKQMTPAYKKALKNEETDETKCNEPELATFGAGCFWGVELTFQRIPGVTKTQVGYCGGGQDNPTYREVCTGLTGHAEVVQLEFNPEIVDFSSLVEVLFERHDPTTLNQQGNDHGTQYRSAIFCHSDEQRKIAEDAKKNIQAQLPSDKNISTEIKKFVKFWPAESNHQQYLEKGGQSAAKRCTKAIRCYG
eukprot:20026_1